jgi:hypothetical protein
MTDEQFNAIKTQLRGLQVMLAILLCCSAILLFQSIKG